MKGAAAVLFLVLVGCQPKANYPEMQFTVTPGLLGEYVRDTTFGIRLRVPAGYRPYDSTRTTRVPAWVDQMNESGGTSHLYVDSLGSSGFVLAALSGYPDTVQQRLINDPDSFFGGATAQTMTFRKGKFILVQQGLVDSTWSGIHVMAMEGSRSRFRFLLYCPRQSYSVAAKSWESSIGSLE